jgi:NAD+ synthetase
VGKPLHNAALFFSEGQLLACARKRLLPSYDVFDEERYFEPGEETVWVNFRGERLGITICEDVWNVPEFLPHFPYQANPIAELKKSSVDILINVSASPYHMGKAAWTTRLLRGHAENYNMQVVHVNQVGGNDELIFHGHSMVFDETGNQVARAADFQEDLIVYDTEARKGDLRASHLDENSEIIEALVLGLRDYVRKCSFHKVILGLSGGIDSAVTACLAALALGPDKVLGIAMPGPYNAPESLNDAQELAERLGIHFSVVPIDDLFSTASKTLSPAFGDLPPDVTEENLQARLRGLILMAFSNKFNRMLLNTGNKSELAVGYCTLYGDMNGGLSVLGDVPKTLVYAIAHKLNEMHDWIPQDTILRPPSAELRPDQKDQDSLPPYELLDAVLTAYVEKRDPVDEIIAQGWDPVLVHWIINKVDHNEYKRWQAPPVLRVTTKAFGSGRRFPIAHGYHN